MLLWWQQLFNTLNMARAEYIALDTQLQDKLAPHRTIIKLYKDSNSQSDYYIHEKPAIDIL